MSLLSDIHSSFGSYFEVVSFVRLHKVGRLLMLSILFYILAYLLSASLIYILIEYFLDQILSLDLVSNYLNWISQFKWILTITKIGIFLASAFFLLSIFKFVFLTLASPLFAYISERTANLVLGKEYPFSLSQFVQDIFRGVLISLRCFLKQMFFTVPLFLLSLIPIIGIFFSFIIILQDSYYYGFSMLDYSSEREKLSVNESIEFISRRKGLAIGNGIIVYLSLLVPIIGISIIAPISAIAATLTFYKHHSTL
jgi:CysZ protein